MLFYQCSPSIFKFARAWVVSGLYCLTRINQFYTSFKFCRKIVEMRHRAKCRFKLLFSLASFCANISLFIIAVMQSFTAEILSIGLTVSFRPIHSNHFIMTTSMSSCRTTLLSFLVSLICLHKRGFGKGQGFLAVRFKRLYPEGLCTQVCNLWSQTILFFSKKGKPRMMGIQSSGATKADTFREANMPSNEVNWKFTKCVRVFFDLSVGESNAMSMISGVSSRDNGSPSSVTRSGQIRTICAPFSIRLAVFMGNSTAGPSIEHFQT